MAEAAGSMVVVADSMVEVDSTVEVGSMEAAATAGGTVVVGAADITAAGVDIAAATMAGGVEDGVTEEAIVAGGDLGLASTSRPTGDTTDIPMPIRTLPTIRTIPIIRITLTMPTPTITTLQLAMHRATQAPRRKLRPAATFRTTL